MVKPSTLNRACRAAHPLRLDRGEDRGEVSNPGNQKTAVNTIPQFLHKASLLIPAEFAETKTAAGRRRMWRTRQARGSHRPSPAGGGRFVAASGKDFQAPFRSDIVAVRVDDAAPTALGRIELKIPIKFSTRFGISAKHLGTIGIGLMKTLDKI